MIALPRLIMLQYEVEKPYFGVHAIGAYQTLNKFLLRDADMHSAYLLQYCIKTAKPILKLFRPSGSPSF